MSENVIEVADSSFDAMILKSELPALLDFWAPWCGPCKAISPTVEQLAAEYKGKLRVAKINVDDNPATPSNFGVRGIPTLILFKGGKEVDRIVGAVSKSNMISLIGKAL
ncbi:MAG: thioredoxin [Deltaproteobacteria bacterium]|nr:thioredoxin [Deltaproteobacteria bacterium]